MDKIFLTKCSINTRDSLHLWLMVTGLTVINNQCQMTSLGIRAGSSKPVFVLSTSGCDGDESEQEEQEDVYINSVVTSVTDLCTSLPQAPTTKWPHKVKSQERCYLYPPFCISVQSRNPGSVFSSSVFL